MGRKRKSNIRLKPVIGIYCEGESEKQYFDMLCQKYNAGNIHTQRIKISVDAVGKSGKRLIETAKKKGEYRHQSQIYVVFDRDDKTNSELQACRKLAKEYNVEILFSSICFEIWILMHFEPVMREYTKEQLFRKLSGSDFFKQDYVRFKGSSYRQFIFDKVNNAMNNANKLYDINNDMINDNPYTDVHLGTKKLFPVNVY